MKYVNISYALSFLSELLTFFLFAPILLLDMSMGHVQALYTKCMQPLLTT
jgi:hypothetical protein